MSVKITGSAWSRDGYSVKVDGEEVARAGLYNQTWTTGTKGRVDYTKHKQRVRWIKKTGERMEEKSVRSDYGARDLKKYLRKQFG